MARTIDWFTRLGGMQKNSARPNWRSYAVRCPPWSSRGRTKSTRVTAGSNSCAPAVTGAVLRRLVGPSGEPLASTAGARSGVAGVSGRGWLGGSGEEGLQARSGALPCGRLYGLARVRSLRGRQQPFELDRGESGPAHKASQGRNRSVRQPSALARTARLWRRARRKSLHLEEHRPTW
jgi:hypothetical protein